MQAENDIICASNMSGEMHMRRRRDAKVRYSAAYPTGAERFMKRFENPILVTRPYLSPLEEFKQDFTMGSDPMVFPPLLTPPLTHSSMSPNRRILLNIVATYGRSLYAHPC